MVLTPQLYFFPWMVLMTYAHTHTESLNKDLASGTVKFGRLVIVDKTVPGDSSHQHKPLFYLPFINSKNIPKDTLEMLMVSAPSSGLKLNYQVADIEIPTSAGAPLKIKIAYDLTVR